jgi:predicted dehydrogenase
MAKPSALGAGLFRSRDPSATAEAVTEPATSAGKGDLVPGFVRAILDGAPAEVEASDVLDSMAVSLAIERSVREGCAVNVDYAPSLPASVE